VNRYHRIVAERDGRSRLAIVEAAAALLRLHGPDALTTRRVAAEAGVHAPAIYRHFGDRDGLLEAVAEHVMAEQVAAKAAQDVASEPAGRDPVQDLRDGWNAQVLFALENPALFRLFSDPERTSRSAAARAGREVLAAKVRRVALAGRLRVPESRAADLLQASAVGTIQTLLSAPFEDRDPGLADATLAMTMSTITTQADEADDRTGPTAAMVAVRAHAETLETLTPNERQLLAEWLDRAIER
jgi:AcrR family transcriptional regulator